MTSQSIPRRTYQISLYMALGLLLTGLAPAQQAGDQVKQLIHSEQIRKDPNPVAAAYLLEWSASTLNDSERKDLRRQVEAALLEKLDVTMMHQASLIQENMPGGVMGGAFKPGNLVGMAAGGLFGGGGSPLMTQSPQDGERMRREFEEKLAAPWIEGMAATAVLESLGHRDAVDRFYRRCLHNNFMVDWFQDRCAAGMIALTPDRAYEFFLKLVREPVMDVELMMGPQMAALMEAQSKKQEMPELPLLRNPGIRGLGRMLAGSALTASQRAEVYSLFEKVGNAKDNDLNLEALAEALGRSGDERGIPILERIAKRAKQDEVKRLASATLAAVFRQPKAVQALQKQLRSGTAEERYQAARHLLPLQDSAALEWIQKALLEDPESIRADFRAPLLEQLAAYDEPFAQDLLRQVRSHPKTDRWISDWAALALLRKGDLEGLDQVLDSVEKGEIKLEDGNVGARAGKSALNTAIKIGVSLAAKAAMEHYLGEVGSLVHQATVGKALGTNDLSGLLQRVVADFAMSEIMRNREGRRLEDQLTQQYFFEAARTLAAVEGDAALRALEKLLENEAPGVALQAAQSLTQRPEREAARALAKAFSRDYSEGPSGVGEPEVKAQILAAAVGIAPDSVETRNLLASATASPEVALKAMAWTALALQDAGH
ncbi:MAG TPA: hypothetical protein VMN76_05830 [Acidobacteriota bacterium]|nr:hypothetical protein [Acidobacteriota bacterium]